MFDFLGHTVRVVTLKDTPWFVSSDVCKALCLQPNPSSGFAHHLRKLAPADVIPTSEVGIKLPGRGMSNARLITETGLYTLVMRSDKPEAKAF